MEWRQRGPYSHFSGGNKLSARGRVKKTFVNFRCLLDTGRHLPPSGPVAIEYLYFCATLPVISGTTVKRSATRAKSLRGRAGAGVLGAQGS